MFGEITAHAALSAIEARRPGLKPAKQHLLMFFAQGHHLAHFDRPLFGEPIIATDRGAFVPHYRDTAEGQPGSEGALNTIGYVVERYGSLSPADLRTLVLMSAPWVSAAFGLITHGALRDWFRRADETNDPDDERPNRAERAQVDALWKSR